MARARCPRSSVEAGPGLLHDRPDGCRLHGGSHEWQIWNQKPTPLVAPVFQIGNAQAGKSRLFSVCEEIFDTCDDVIGEHVHSMLGEGPPVTLQSITLQSFTFTEFFYRSSSSFPLVVFPEGDELQAIRGLWRQGVQPRRGLRILGRPRPPGQRPRRR